MRRAEVLELPEDETFMVALAEHPDGGGRSLLFQSKLDSDYDAQDVRLGQDTHCVCDEDAVVAYAAVAACELTDSTFALTYAPEAAAELGVPERCRYPLDLEPQTIEQVRTGLRRVLSSGRVVTDPLAL